MWMLVCRNSTPEPCHSTSSDFMPPHVGYRRMRTTVTSIPLASRGWLTALFSPFRRDPKSWSKRSPWHNFHKLYVYTIYIYIFIICTYYMYILYVCVYIYIYDIYIYTYILCEGGKSVPSIGCPDEVDTRWLVRKAFVFLVLWSHLETTVPLPGPWGFEGVQFSQRWWLDWWHWLHTTFFRCRGNRNQIRTSCK